MPVLIVEDRIPDVDKARVLLAHAGVEKVKVLRRVSLAIEFLEQVVAGEEPRPRGILLDLLLEPENGFEVLRFYHAHPELKDIPVVVWTQVAGQTDRLIAHWLGAKKYLTKNTGEPSMINHLQEVFNSRGVGTAHP
ncbi:MAG: response regulator [Acidobacteria bacterium]|nr:response regulator [Acidobacteriota bacterium]